MRAEQVGNNSGVRPEAIALLSGGLDSVLAVRVILEQGIRVTAIRFMTYFGCDAGGGGSCGHDVSGLAKELGFEIKLCHLGQEYAQMVRNPKYGHGKNMNPCIDCRAMMLRWAKEYMETEQAAFIITGEVLGQRPMSQHREAFRLIDREVGLEGLILRPLSAKLLAPTIPEQRGWVDRQRLFDISGRSRKRQYELAAQYGIKDFGQPAGGCLLTDPGYSARLRDLFGHGADPRVSDLQLLKVGRHFRLHSVCKVIVGRDEQENIVLQGTAEGGDAMLYLKDFVGPLTLVRGEFTEQDLRFAAQVTARYGDAPKDVAVKVIMERKQDGTTLISSLFERAASSADLAPYRITMEQKVEVASLPTLPLPIA